MKTRALREAVDEYLALRRSLGFKLVDAGYLLPQFICFLEKKRSSYVRAALAVEWARQPTRSQSATWTRRLSVVRSFAQFRSAADPRTEIPSVGLLPHRYQRKAPYIYSENEIVRLIAAAKHLPSKTGLREHTYSTLLGLLAVTGLRISEALGLDSADVDLSENVLTIRRTKFGKSRLVPIHATTQRALERYARLRDRIHRRPKSPSFFVGETGGRMSQCGVRYTFVQLSRRVGLRIPSKSHGHGPRLHDFRHRLAVAALLRWYREGADVERHLPKLAAFLGHTHITDTYWYLTAVPELLQLAAARLDEPRGQLS